MKKISIAIFICILFQSVNVNAQPLNSINVVGMSFNYDGLFNNSDTEFSGLLAPLNQDQRDGYRNLDGDSGWSGIEIIGWVAVVAVVAVALKGGNEDECIHYQTGQVIPCP